MSDRGANEKTAKARYCFSCCRGFDSFGDFGQRRDAQHNDRGIVAARETSFEVYSVEPFTEPMGCSVNNMLRVYSDAPNYNVTVSTIITAFSTGKSIKFWVAECDGGSGATGAGGTTSGGGLVARVRHSGTGGQKR
jgi:hypothetical protein